MQRSSEAIVAFRLRLVALDFSFAASPASCACFAVADFRYACLWPNFGTGLRSRHESGVESSGGYVMFMVDMLLICFRPCRNGLLRFLPSKCRRLPCIPSAAPAVCLVTINRLRTNTRITRQCSIYGIRPAENTTQIFLQRFKVYHYMLWEVIIAMP